MAEWPPGIQIGPDGEPIEVPLTPEEIAQKDAMAAGEAKRQGAQAFESSEDAERLAVIRDRAATDPAFAALADFVLKGVRV